jgi:hypothetical protein
MWRTLLSVTLALVYVTYGYVLLGSSMSIAKKFLGLLASLPNLFLYIALIAFYDQMPRGVRIGVGAAALILTALVLSIVKARRPKVFASLQLIVGFGAAIATCSTLDPGAPVTLAQTVAFFGIVSLIGTGYTDLFKKDTQTSNNPPLNDLPARAPNSI